MATTGPESTDPTEKVTEVLQFSVEGSLFQKMPDLLQKAREAIKAYTNTPQMAKSLVNMHI